MGRSALVIKTAELQACISKLEADKTFATLGELCEAVENTDWARGIRNEKHVIRGLSAQVVGREIKARGITVQTKPGARGRVIGQVVNKRSRRDKVAGLKIGKFAAALRKEVSDAPERYQKYAEAALEGNAIAAIKLKCGSCMGYTGAEKACDGGLGGTPCPNYIMNRLIFVKRLGLEQNPKSGFFELAKAAGVELS
jgi:hypothetical protein